MNSPAKCWRLDPSIRSTKTLQLLPGSVQLIYLTRSPQGLKVGDKVAVQPTIACLDKCGPCEDGYINCCDAAGFVGLSGGGGGMSDAVCVDGQFVFKLPDHVGLDVGALVEPLAVAWHAVDQVSATSPN